MSLEMNTTYCTLPYILPGEGLKITFYLCGKPSQALL
jgi:hypothetical protein